VTDGASGSETGKLTLSSGGTALEGYFYQLDVSILTALDLVLAKKVQPARPDRDEYRLATTVPSGSPLDFASATRAQR
jgi:hypothetical protein